MKLPGDTPSQAGSHLTKPILDSSPSESPIVVSWPSLHPSPLSSSPALLSPAPSLWPPLTPVLVCNVDGSKNENGSVMEEVHITLHFRHHSERAHLAVVNLGQQMVIIEHSWLTLHNLEVDWATQKVSMT